MFLKNITIKGFKSFADTASLDLEPGVTVVVGPNGSGKSNVVDAIAWVLGAQKPSSVRSQKMDDVIFAGTSKKAALGRAEVSLTIDNSDGELPIDFTEVTIRRILFRTGESEYAINGVTCRLLDIQDLLSDSGVGRQQHIIISQGQIDAVLNARPEERRSIIEEAAGILKFRKRKERAERRLASTEENMNRLADLLREIRRQLKPLQKQAEAARLHGDLISEVTVLKTHLLGRELRALTSQLEASHRERSQLASREFELRTSLAEMDAKVLDGEAELAALGGSDIGEVVAFADRLAERIKGQKSVIGERRLRLQRELQSAVDEGVVSSLEAEAARIVADLATSAEEFALAEPEFAEIELAETEFAEQQANYEKEWSIDFGPAPVAASEVRAKVSALESAAKRDAQEAQRLADQMSVLEQRSERLSASRTEALETVARLQPDIGGLEAAVAESTKALTETETRVQTLAEERRSADADANRWKARADALDQALNAARSRAGADALVGSNGVLGTLLDLVDIDSGWEAAVEAAAGEALSAVVVDSTKNAAEALDALAKRELSGAVLALGAAAKIGSPPSVGESIRSHVRALRPDVEPMLDALFSSAVVTKGDWRTAVDVALDNPDVLVVTLSGDRFGPRGWSIGQSGTGATGAALEEATGAAGKAAEKAKLAEEAHNEAVAELDRFRSEVRRSEEAFRRATIDLDQATAAAERTVNELTDLAADRDRLAQQRTEILERQSGESDRLNQLQLELPGLVAEQEAHQNKVRAAAEAKKALDETGSQLAKRRHQLEVSTAAVEERIEILKHRQVEIESRLTRLVAERATAKNRREEVEGSMSAVAELAERLDAKSEQLGRWIRLLATEQTAQSAAAQDASGILTELRSRRSKAEKEMTEVRERTNRLDLADAENKVRLENLTMGVRTELDTEPEVAMNTECPELPEGVSAEARVRTLDRDLKSIGPINPLALEEYEELSERHDFMSEQVDDVRSSRRQLRKLIREIDEEIVSVFSSAYADVASNFTELFNTLFPGGRGAVKLTDSGDLLNCGIEIEAKPSGKNVKKLSLLSGGERSLTALGFLFAVFRSRPSPFYVMDEVEAALDDMNLHRFLSLVEEFRKDAQLIIVTHQKRTMESADVLYGVSMKPGGSSKVVSEKAKVRSTPA